MGALTRRDLARRINQELGFSIRVSQKLVDKLLLEMRLALNEGNRIKLSRFGSFYPVKRVRRTGLHPMDKRPIEIPPKWSVAFRPSRILKAIVNGEQGEKILPDWRGQ